MTPATHNSANLRQPVTKEDAAYGHGRAEQSEPTPERKNGVQFLAVSLFVLLCAMSASAYAPTSRAVLVNLPVPQITLAWTPNPLALDTVIEGTISLTSPQWSVVGICYNDLTNSLTLPRTNATEFFRACSE